MQEKSAFHAKCTVCKKAFSSSSMLDQHMQSKKHQLMSSKSPSGPSAISDEPKPKPEILTEMNTAPEKEKEEEGEGEKMVEDNDEGMEAEKEEEEEGQEDVPEAMLEPEVCIFCNHVSRSVDSNVVHMLKSHGFFIPDAEYLQDLQGLVGYCGEKVKLGKICLYCNGKGKGFHRYSDVQRHMMDKSHCKLLYQEGEDMEEFEDFYDFSSSYDVEGPEEGDEDMEIDSEDEDLVSKTLKVSDIGELVLLDGRVAGHRQYRRYYKQQYRPEDSREAVQAFKTEVSAALILIVARGNNYQNSHTVRFVFLVCRGTDFRIGSLSFFYRRMAGRQHLRSDQGQRSFR